MEYSGMVPDVNINYRDSLTTKIPLQLKANISLVLDVTLNNKYVYKNQEKKYHTTFHKLQL